MRLRIRQLLRGHHYAGMRRALIVLGLIITLVPAIVFLFQARLENRSFYEREQRAAWQLASLEIARINTGAYSQWGQNHYYLVTEDFGRVTVDLLLCDGVIGEAECQMRFDPEGGLTRDASHSYLSYSGSIMHDDKEHFRALFLLFSSDNCSTIHLNPEDEIVGCFVSTRSIAQEKRELMLSHLTKLLLWLGLCGVLIFILIVIGGGLIKQLEAVNRKLVKAERDSLINKIICTYNHRINSPLQGIFGSIDLLTSNETDSGKIRLIRSMGEAAESIKTATDEIAIVEKYRFVDYPGGDQMIVPEREKGERDESRDPSRSVGYRVGEEGSFKHHR